MDLIKSLLIRTPQGAIPAASQLQPCQVQRKEQPTIGITNTSTTPPQHPDLANRLDIFSAEEWSVKIDAPNRSIANEHAVADFHILCSRLGLAASFDITESARASFQARVKFGSHVVEDNGQYPSKKDAKRVVALQGIPILQAMLDADKKAAAQQQVEKSDTSGENWVGMLTEYCQAAHMPTPEFTFVQQTEQTFTCTASLAAAPSLVFGNLTHDSAFSSKKTAKTAAAQAAVQWLRDNGHMEGSGSNGEPTRKKQRGASSADDNDNDNDNSGGAETLLHGASPKGPSLAQQVVDLCLKLDLSPPTYRVEDEPSAPALYSGTAVFAPACGIEGTVGSVRHVYGRKHAKEELAKQVLKFLEEERGRRVAQMAELRELYAKEVAGRRGV